MSKPIVRSEQEIAQATLARSLVKRGRIEPIDALDLATRNDDQLREYGERVLDLQFRRTPRQS